MDTPCTIGNATWVGGVRDLAIRAVFLALAEGNRRRPNRAPGLCLGALILPSAASLRPSPNLLALKLPVLTLLLFLEVDGERRFLALNNESPNPGLPSRE